MADASDLDRLINERLDALLPKKLAELREAALARFGLIDLAVVHRCGELEPGDQVVLIAAAAEHRAAAFEGCSWCIDERAYEAPSWSAASCTAARGATRTTSRRRPIDSPRRPASMSASVCAMEMKKASNWDGGR